MNENLDPTDENFSPEELDVEVSKIETEVKSGVLDSSTGVGTATI